MELQQIELQLQQQLFLLQLEQVEQVEHLDYLIQELTVLFLHFQQFQVLVEAKGVAMDLVGTQLVQVDQEAEVMVNKMQLEQEIHLL